MSVSETMFDSPLSTEGPFFTDFTEVKRKILEAVKLKEAI